MQRGQEPVRRIQLPFGQSKVAFYCTGCCCHGVIPAPVPGRSVAGEKRGGSVRSSVRTVCLYVLQVVEELARHCKVVGATGERTIELRSTATVADGQETDLQNRVLVCIECAHTALRSIRVRLYRRNSGDRMQRRRHKLPLLRPEGGSGREPATQCFLRRKDQKCWREDSRSRFTLAVKTIILYPDCQGQAVLCKEHILQDSARKGPVPGCTQRQMIPVRNTVRRMRARPLKMHAQCTNLSREGCRP